MLSSLKVAKKYMHVYYYHGKNFTCWDLRGMLETDSFGQKDSKLTLLLHLKEAILHLKSENQCWTRQFLLASEI